MTALAAVAGIRSRARTVSVGSIPTWLARVASVGTPTAWYRFGDSSGSTLTATQGSNGTILNPTLFEYHLGPLLADSGGGDSMAFGGGSFPAVAMAEVPTIQSAAQTVVMVLQIDAWKDVSQVLYTVNGGDDLAGEWQVSLVDNGTGGLVVRILSMNDTPSPVIAQGAAPTVIPPENSIILGFVRTANNLLAYLNGTPFNLSIVSGTLPFTWSAPAAGVATIGAFPGGSSRADVIMSELLIYNSALSGASMAVLGSHQRSSIVTARSFTSSSIAENAGQTSIPLVDNIHPAQGVTVAITSQPVLGSALAGVSSVLYTPAQVAADTQTSLGYQISHANGQASGTLSFTVLNVGGAEPPIIGLLEDVALPAPNAVHNVSNASQLTTALTNAANGDHIILANGSYGAFTISRNGASNARIVVRAANLLQATFQRLTISGNWVIVSGVVAGAGLVMNGSNSRFTRGEITNSSTTITVGAGVANSIIDHSNVDDYNDYGVLLSTPETQSGLIIARCWFHDAVAGSDGVIQTFAWSNGTAYRGNIANHIARFNYIGPGLPNPNGGSDHIHNKGPNGRIYAFNRFDTINAGNRLMHNRNGVNTWFIGNYAPNHRILMFDYDCWSLGNFVEEIRAKGGNSNLYDPVKSGSTWNGVTGQTAIQYALGRGRIAGNNAAIVLGHHSESYCSQLPQAAGRIKLAASAGGVTYPADGASANNGVHIYDNSQAPTTVANSCIAWTANITNSWQIAPPASWATALPAWITDIVDPTDRSSTPWSIAQALTRGDAGTPSTGPHRNSPGGLMP